LVLVLLITDGTRFSEQCHDLLVNVGEVADLERVDEVLRAVLVDPQHARRLGSMLNQTPARRWSFRVWQPANRTRVMKPIPVLFETSTAGPRLSTALRNASKSSRAQGLPSKWRSSGQRRQE
jgi:hypothetical protein